MQDLSNVLSMIDRKDKSAYLSGSFKQDLLKKVTKLQTITH